MSYFEVVEMKQYYRVVTSALSHAENLHIFMNMLTFAYFGEQCEKIYGTVFFAFLNLWCLIIGVTFTLGYKYVMINVVYQGDGDDTLTMNL